MSIGAGAFHILTEFRFEAGSALVTSDKLTKAVSGISDAAEAAQLSFQKLGMGIVGYMGLGTGSVFGLLQAAMQASDKFGQAQRNLANIFISNNLFTGANAFTDSMLQAETVMSRIRDKAQEFSLSASAMAKLSTTVGAQLIAEGLDTSELKKTIELARGYAKSAGIIGFDPDLAMGQLQRTVGGGASMGDPLFARLVAETIPMEKLRGGDASKKFNAMLPAARLNMLTAALTQFGTNTEIVKANAQSLSGEMQRLRDSLVGMFSILRPIGDVINNFILPAFHDLNNFLQKEGAQIGSNISKLLKSMLSDPETLIVNLMQARKLKSDMAAVGGTLGTAGFIAGIGSALAFLTKRAWMAHPAIAAVGAGLYILKNFMDRVNSSFAGKMGMWSSAFILIIALLAKFGVLITALSFVFNAILIPVAALLALFQLFSRAQAIAAKDDAKAIAKGTPAFTRAILFLKTALDVVLNPLISMFEKIAQAIAPVFRMSFWFDALTWAITKAAEAVMLVLAGFQGVDFAMRHLFSTIDQYLGLSNGPSPFKSMGEAFNAGVDDMIQQVMSKVDSGEGGVVNSVTNIAKVTIENQFKEQMEPDRIAFTLVEQLQKVAQNPTQSLNRSLSKGLNS